MDSQLANFKGRGLHTFIFWMIIILVVAIDQATKAAAEEILEDGPKVLLPGIINLVHVENTGAAFSMGEGGNLFFVIVAIVCIVGAILFVWREPELPMPLVVSIGLVAGGGMGNMIDRLMSGSVTDFIATAFMRFPVFNVADICVTVGIVYSIIWYWVWDARREEAAGIGTHLHA